ncbi:MAG TPA: PilZ domain-containing protein [Tepidisphaeraceae bacterium]|jgi:hypothetical protein
MVALLKMPRSITEATGAERRIFPRRDIQARVNGRRLDHTLPALQMPHLKLELRDLSMGGLSATSDHPLEAGERISVIFPEMDMRRGWDATGHVIRCQPSALGYRVAVAFDPLPMAA